MVDLLKKEERIRELYELVREKEKIYQSLSDESELYFNLKQGRYWLDVSKRGLSGFTIGGIIGTILAQITGCQEGNWYAQIFGIIAVNLVLYQMAKSFIKGKNPIFSDDYYFHEFDVKEKIRSISEEMRKIKSEICEIYAKLIELHFMCFNDEMIPLIQADLKNRFEQFLNERNYDIEEPTLDFNFTFPKEEDQNIEEKLVNAKQLWNSILEERDYSHVNVESSVEIPYQKRKCYKECLTIEIKER